MITMRIIKTVILKNGHEQDIVRATTIETINVIIIYLRNVFFFILVDESHDLLGNEQMVIVLRFECVWKVSHVGKLLKWAHMCFLLIVNY